MDYTKLSKKFLEMICQYYQARSQQQLSNAVHGEAFAIQYISRHDDVAVPSDIENAMSVSSARIATLLSSLEKKELITRRIDPKDRRRVILRLTKAGKERAQKSEQELLGLIKKILMHLGKEDAQNYVRIMGKLAQGCNNDWQ